MKKMQDSACAEAYEGGSTDQKMTQKDYESWFDDILEQCC
jgi:hypothetical protein